MYQKKCIFKIFRYTFHPMLWCMQNACCWNKLKLSSFGVRLTAVHYLTHGLTIFKTKLKPSGLWVWLTKATWAGAQLWSHLHSTFTSASSPSQKPAFLFPASAQPSNLSGYWRWCCSSESGGVLTGFNPPQGWALPHTDPGGQHQPDQQESASAQSSQQGANS